MLTIANLSAQIPMPAWIMVAWWGFTAVSALVSMLLLSIFHNWNLHRGYEAWTVLAGEEGEVTSGSWKKLWWWIPVSYIVLIASLFGFAMFQQTM